MHIFVKLFIAFCVLSAINTTFAQQTGIITGTLPQIAYSNGPDRLGSAKAGYIDTGLLVKIVETGKTTYTIQLSKNRTAFIDKDFIKIVKQKAPTQPELTQSWMVKGGANNDDTVAITMGSKVLYRSWMEVDPAVIKLELYNVQGNTNWITQLSSAKGIKNVDWVQIEDDVIQVSIALQQKQHFGYSICYNENKLQLVIKRIPEHLQIQNLKIAIDAGHGGSNTGARGSSSTILEKDYTIKFAKALQQILLDKNVDVIMTRSIDTTIDNKDRIVAIDTLAPDLLISFHLNSSSRTTARGTSTYYKHVGLRPVTQFILNELLTIDNLPEFGNIGSFNFQLVQPTNYPSCLVEVAFLSNLEDEVLIMNEAFQQEVALKVYQGILNWLEQLD